MTTYEINVCEPYFSMLGYSKTIEGRLFKGKFAMMAVGDVLTLSLDKSVKSLTITKVERFVSFEQMLLDADNLAVTLPGTTSVDEGVQVYRQFYSQEDETQYGVVAITVNVTN